MYLSILLWTLLLLVSFWGYGKLLSEKLLRLEGDIVSGWGLPTALGLSVVIFLGGLLMLFGIAFPKTLSAMIWIGAFCALWLKGQEISSQGFKWPPLQHPTDIILIALALLAFLTSIYWPHQIDVNDDWIAYLMFPERILQTGTFIDEFSLRRVNALGGQSLLQAIVMIVGSPENGHILDRGIGAILLLTLLFEISKDIDKKWWFIRFLGILAAMAVSVPRISTTSHLLGMVLLLAMICILDRVDHLKTHGILNYIPIILILAGVSTLRPIFAITGGFVIILFGIILCIRSPEKIRRSILMTAFIGITTFFVLIPYMILSWKSSKTPMFPLMTGTANLFQMFGGTKEGGLADWIGAVNFIASPQIVVMFLGMLLISFIPRKQRALAYAVAISALLAVFLSAFKMSASSFYDVYRYTYPLAGFAFFWILLRIITFSSIKKENPVAAPLSVGLAICLFFSAHWQSMFAEFKTEISTIPTQIKGFSFVVAQLKPFYKELQERVPAGEKIFSIVDAPYLLDFSRNPIDCVDSPGGASPHPGMPFGQGAEVLRDYLRAKGFRYILCVDFGNAVQLYTRKLHENHPRPEWYMKEVSKRYFMDFFNNMDDIALTTEISQAGNVRLLDLDRGTR